MYRIARTYPAPPATPALAEPQVQGTRGPPPVGPQAVVGTAAAPAEGTSAPPPRGVPLPQPRRSCT